MKKRTGRKVITVILVVIVCMFALFPFVWMISTSFKTAGEVYSKTPSFTQRQQLCRDTKEALQPIPQHLTLCSGWETV